MRLDGLVRELPDDMGERVLVAVDCAKADRIGPDLCTGRAREARRRHRPSPRQHALRLGQPHRLRRVVDGRGAARRLRRARRRDHAGDRRAAVHRARHRHGPLPVHEHDAEVAAARGRARRGRAPTCTRCSSRCTSRVEFAKLKLLARALDRARVLEGGRIVVSHLVRTDFAEVGAVEAVLGRDHRLPARGRRLRARGADPRAAARRRPDAACLAARERRRARRVRDRAALRRRRPSAGSRVLEREVDRRDHRARPAGIRRRSVPPRALDPAGVALVDKPAGPSSFAIVSQIRRMTGARTGHAGTLDPFATGLLLLLSGRATKLTPQLVGLDKRYLTDVDLRTRTSTGDPEGDDRRDARAAGRGRARAPPRCAPRRDRAADPGCVRGEDRRRACVRAGAPRCRGRDAAAALDRVRARRRRVSTGDIGDARHARQLGHVRARDRARARRALQHASADRGRPVRRRRCRDARRVRSRDC